MIGRENVTAVRDIQKGEEILTTYISVCRTREQRAQELSKYGFVCVCAACDLCSSAGRASQERRRSLLQLDQQLATHTTFRILSPFRNDREALRAAMKVLAVLREEGIVNMELTRR